MGKRLLLFLIAAGIATGLAYNVGYRIGYGDGGKQALRASMYTAEGGWIREGWATFLVRGGGYTMRGAVPWTDTSGSLHGDGWPECLHPYDDPKGVQFAGVTVWHEDVGFPYVTWVDCRTRS